MLSFFKKFGKQKKIVHLDFASTTPVAPEVFRAMQPYFSEEWANPSAVYASGVRARNVVEEARTTIARILRIRPQGVLFTSGGTESNNQAIIGIVESLHARGRQYETMEIVTTRIEHPSILETCDMLRTRGVVIRFADVDEGGSIVEKNFSSLLTENTVLVTCAYVNSEVGVIQDVKRLTRTVRAFNSEHTASVLVHLDASQAPLWLPCEMDMLGVDLMTLDAGKCYGPKGVGVLAIRHGVAIAPLMLGGGQEGGLRSGTENVPLIVGCAAALVRAQSVHELRSKRVTVLRDLLIDLLMKEIPSAVLNGSGEARVANNVNISIPGIDAEYAVITLDAHGVAASTKSACGTNTSHGSYVVRAMTNAESRATSTIRFTLGESTTQSDLVFAVTVLKDHVIKMLSFSSSITQGKV